MYDSLGKLQSNTHSLSLMKSASWKFPISQSSSNSPITLSNCDHVEHTCKTTVIHANKYFEIESWKKQNKISMKYTNPAYQHSLLLQAIRASTLYSLVPDLGCVWVLKFPRFGSNFGEGHTWTWNTHKSDVESLKSYQEQRERDSETCTNLKNPPYGRGLILLMLFEHHAAREWCPMSYNTNMQNTLTLKGLCKKYLH